MLSLTSPAAVAQLYATAADSLCTIAAQYYHRARFKEAQSILDITPRILDAQVEA